MEKEEIELIVYSIIGVLILLGLVIWFANTLTSVQCHKKAEALGYKCTYGPLQGCILEKPDGRKVLLEQLRDYDK